MDESATASAILVMSAVAALLHPTAACIVAERMILLVFKVSIEEDSYGMLSRWIADGDFSSWGGTPCDSFGYVTEIDLACDRAFDNPNIFLNGTILPELTKLTHLTRLDLANLKELSGLLPESFGDLTSLEYFSVRTYKLMGSISTSFADLTNLTWMDLGANMLKGLIPTTLGNTGPQLLYLFLGYSNLFGLIPLSLYNLSMQILIAFCKQLG